MWKSDSDVQASATPQASVATPTAEATTRGVRIGPSVVIRGELNGSEDLTIEGQVEGKIELRQNILTIGPNGRIKAQVFAKTVIILGEVIGNVTAFEKVEIRDNGSVNGDIAAPRVSIAEGAHFRGSIDMQGSAYRKPLRTPAPARLAVEIYIRTADPAGDHKKLESIQRAVAEMLESFGYEPEPETVSVAHSSWHWKEWFRKNGRAEQEASEIYDGVKEALRRQQIDIAGATAFEKRAQAAAELLKAFESYESAVARLGDVIIAKAVIAGKARVAIETVSPPLARELERNPALMRNPEAFFALLDTGQSLTPPAA